MADSTALTAAAFIKTVDPRLASLFLSQPFRRVQIAQAFAKGLRNDTAEMGLTIIALAEIDRDERLEAAQ